jgi:hypothetical protein
VGSEQINVGARVLVVHEHGTPWYDGVVLSTTEDGEYAEVKEAGVWWFPEREWHPVKNLRAIGVTNPYSGLPPTPNLT